MKLVKTKKHPHYWKVKAAFLQRQQTLTEIRLAGQAADAVLNQAMLDAGLDPAEQYQMDDATETITLAPKV